MQKAISFNDFAIVYVKGSAYTIHFWYMSKDDAINTMNNSILIDKMVLYNFFSFHIKNEWLNVLPEKQRCNTK